MRLNRVKKTCPCGKEFEIKASRADKARYCSRVCRKRFFRGYTSTKKQPRLLKICACGNSFEVLPRLKERKKYCSLLCKRKFAIKKSGFKRRDFYPNPSWFQKEQKPWNEGTKDICKPNNGSFRSGEHRSPETEFKHGDKAGETNIKWKGDDVGYFALHTWVRRTLGIPTICIHCSITANERKIHWANKSREYRRDINDWIALCSKCHGRFDRGNRGAIKRRFGCAYA